MSKKIVLMEDIVTDTLHRFLGECDADELARLVEECFGGKCYFSGGGEYTFYPDENYTGAFDDIET